MSFQLVDAAADAVPLHPISKPTLADWLAGLPGHQRGWAERAGFKAEPGSTLLLPDAAGELAGIAVGVEPPDHADRGLWAYAGLPEALPPGRYRIAAALERDTATNAALGWALGTYGFARYKARKGELPSLVWPAEADRGHVQRAAEATALARDLINTPAADLGPAELAAAARAVAERHGAPLAVIVGDDLLANNYPAIHAVGRASAKPPCLIDLRWGRDGDPKVTLVGKGVCFDSGGLDIKASAGMRLMKKDMGGAATVLALAAMVMGAGLKVRLRLLIPAVENMIAGNAMRPLDVLPTRKGPTVEVGNTDAEGRLILCDALAEADTEQPTLLIDCATLTGAARVALGPELPVAFTRHDALYDALARHGAATADPVWRLPLWPGYRRLLDSKTADLSSTGDGPHAGAITAALFLSEFVSADTPWLHLDMMAWNNRARPGRPEGGEPQTLRALYALVQAHAAA
ncbi:MAG: leucyl aminopeptidase family protein [Proteobacteria bacterium]|nr:leucyl aminopeptidase family protein [Pseudomonadota bacterium]